jgi:hypothetical protein
VIGVVQHKQTKADKEEGSLTEQQHTAIVLIVAGKTFQDVGEAVGVHRQAVSKWVHHNPLFQAELNRCRQELWSSLLDRLRGLAPLAIEVLATALEEEKSVTAALSILKVCGFPGVPLVPLGAVDSRLLSAQMQEAENLAATASDEVAVAAKRKAYFRNMDNLQYGLS